MAWTGWEEIYGRQEASPLDRFKNKNKILKTFGPPGVRTYDELDGRKSARQVQTALGIEADLFAQIMEQLLGDGAIAASGSASQEAHPTAPSTPEELMMPPPSEREPPVLSPRSASPRSTLPQPPSISPADVPPSSPDNPISPSIENRPRSPPEARRPTPPASIQPPGASVRAADLSPPPANSRLSPLEKLISDKYGAVGLKVYELIDGERTAEDILNETGVSESKLVEILEFMNEQGIIKLDRPLRNPGGAGSPAGRPDMPGGMGTGGAPGAARPPMMASGRPESTETSAPARPTTSSEDGVGFKPMVESDGDAAEAGLSSDALPVDVPVLPARQSLVQKAKTMAILAGKHGKVGHDLLDHIDGNKDFVQLSIETGLSLRDLDIILGELGKSGLLTFKPLNRIEVRHRYGDDGLAIYRKYGRDGLLIYQMIGKVESLREIVKRSRIEPQRAVDILIFVHRVLGLELPVDRDMIYRYLTKG